MQKWHSPYSFWPRFARYIGKQNSNQTLYRGTYILEGRSVVGAHVCFDRELLQFLDYLREYLFSLTRVKCVLSYHLIHVPSVAYCTVCLRSSDPFYIVTIKWVTTSYQKESVVIFVCLIGSYSVQEVVTQFILTI